MIYQVTYLISDEKDKSALKPAVSAVGADVLDERVLGKRKLAYPIGKLNEAIYVTSHIDIAQDKLIELEKKLQFQDEILRFIIVRTEKIITPKSIVEPVKVTAEKLIEKPVEKAPVVKTKPDKKIEAVPESKRLKALDKKLEELLKE